MTLYGMRDREKNHFWRIWLSVFLAFCILVSGGVNGSIVRAEGEDSEEELPSYYSEFSKPYADHYDDYSLTFSWYSSGTNTGFDIYRKTDYHPEYEWIGSVANERYNLLEFTDYEFRRGFTYSYQVVAYQDEGEEHIELDTVTGSWKLKINQVEIESVKRVDQVKAKLTWSASSGVDGYEIYTKTAGESYKRAKRITNPETLVYTLKDISTAKKTYFKVRGFVKADGVYAYGAFSTVEALEKSALSKLELKFQKLQKKYPDGKYWNHVGKSSYTSATVTDSPCYHSAWDGLAETCNYYNCPDGVLGYQCYGFAWKMSDLLYGKKKKIKNFYSFAKCKAGDVIRYSGHSVIILKKHSDYITVGECNYGDTCMIRWGRKVYKSELTGAKYSRRYA